MRDSLTALLRGHPAADATEAAHQRRMLELADAPGDPFSRSHHERLGRMRNSIPEARDQSELRYGRRGTLAATGFGSGPSYTLRVHRAEDLQSPDLRPPRVQARWTRPRMGG